MIVRFFLDIPVKRRHLKPAIADLVQEFDSMYQVAVQNGKDARQGIIRHLYFFFAVIPKPHSSAEKICLA